MENKLNEEATSTVIALTSTSEVLTQSALATERYINEREREQQATSEANIRQIGATSTSEALQRSAEGNSITQTSQAHTQQGNFNATSTANLQLFIQNSTETQIALNIQATRTSIYNSAISVNATQTALSIRENVVDATSTAISWSPTPSITPIPTTTPLPTVDYCLQRVNDTVTQGANLRLTQEENDPDNIIKSLSPRTVVIVLATNTVWYYVHVDGDDGYILKEYLEDVSGSDTQWDTNCRNN